jgi:hypothetical protein
VIGRADTFTPHTEKLEIMGIGGYGIYGLENIHSKKS